MIRPVSSASVPVARPRKRAAAAEPAGPAESFTPSASVNLSKKTASAAAFGATGMVLGAGMGVVSLVGHAPKSLKKLVEDVRECLTDDLRKPDYRGNPNPMAGHCYVASEAIYHDLGGKAEGWKPMHINHEGGPHWYLQNDQGIIVDPTADQFKTPVPYDQGKGMGFLTKQPSKRAQVVLDRLEDKS